MAGSFNTCTVQGRQDFFNEVNKDKNYYRERLSARDYDELRVVIEIGYDMSSKRANIGHRVFRTLAKLERFLDLARFSDGTISGGRGETTNPLDWSKHGLCKYKKRAHISVYEMRGERVIRERILKRYKLTS